MVKLSPTIELPFTARARLAQVRYWGQLTCLLVLVLSAGCSSRPKTIGMRGEVSYGGNAIERGTVDFIPIDGTAGPSAGAAIVGGRYDVSGKDGVLPGGTYLVRIIGLKKTGKTEWNRLLKNGAPVELEENFIPPIYNSESTLKVHISDLPDRDKVNFHLGTISLPAGR